MSDQQPNKHNLALRSIATLPQAGKDILPALKSTWPYIFLGLLIGCLLLLLGHEGPSLFPRFPGSEVAFFLLEHLGMGLIVSATAVFFYEWGAHHKKILDHSRRLAEIQDQLSKLLQEKGVAALDHSLAALLPDDGKEAVNLRKYLLDIVRGLSQLHGSSMWARDGYLACLGQFLEVVRNNVRSLSNLVPSEPSEHLYSLGGELTADGLLAAQMSALEAGDSYEVISHLESWTDGRLAKLHRESGLALKRGVKIKRLFNLARDCAMLEPESVRRILMQHLEYKKGRGAYQVRVLLRSHISQGIPKHLRQRIESVQAAFFKHKNGRIRIKIDRTDLTEIFLSAHVEPKADKELFEDIWELGRDLDEDLIEGCVRAVRSSRKTPNPGPQPDDTATAVPHG
jgi:hypothetical protein